MIFTVFLIILGIVILWLMFSSAYTVRQQSVAIIERLGKFHLIANSGFHFRLPFGIDSIAAVVQLRILQKNIIVETKTKDNVFIKLAVATQYRVSENKSKRCLLFFK